MEHAHGFMQSHWMPSSDKCPHRINPAATMVIVVKGVEVENKTHN
jgi:hypothetical protein